MAAIAAVVVLVAIWFCPGDLEAPPIADPAWQKHSGFRNRVHLRQDSEGRIVEHNCSDPNCSSVIGAEWAPDAIKTSGDR
jgi:hypothetical protein